MIDPINILWDCEVSRVNLLCSFVPNLCVLSLFSVTHVCLTFSPNDQKAFQLALYFSVKKKVLDKLINAEALGA